MTFDILPAIIAALDSCCVIGAYALAARGYVRQTTDFDLMTTDRRALEERTWDALREREVRVDVRRGDSEDPLAGVVRTRSTDVSIDVIVAKYRWQQEVIDRSERMTILGVPLAVPQTADLILLKLFAGGPADDYDILQLLEVGPRSELIDDVDARIASMPDEMHRRWETLRSRH